MQKATLYLENNCYALLGLKQVVNAVEKVIKLLTKLAGDISGHTISSTISPTFYMFLIFCRLI